MLLPAPFSTLVAALLLTAPAALAGERVHAGNWEATMVTDGETTKLVFCLDAAHAAALNADSAGGKAYAAKKAGDRCTVKSYQAAGETVTYTLACGPRTIKDETHFHGETSDGVKTVSFEGEVTTTKITSRRLGACP